MHRAEKEMSDLEKMVDQKVQALHERLRGKEEEFQVHIFTLPVHIASSCLLFHTRPHAAQSFMIVHADHVCRNNSRQWRRDWTRRRAHSRSWTHR